MKIIFNEKYYSIDHFVMQQLNTFQYSKLLKSIKRIFELINISLSDT